MRTLFTLALIAAFPALSAGGEFSIGPEGPIVPKRQRPENHNQPRTVALTITPAPEPTPALKWRFDVPVLERKPGNSALYYYRALFKLSHSFDRQQKREFYDLYDKAADIPLSEFPSDQVREMFKNYNYQAIFKQLERGFTRSETDWGRHIEELPGSERISLILPEVENAGELARLIYLKGRLELAQGRFRDAEQTLRIGYQLARAVADTPTMVQSLTGSAIAGTMNGLVYDWIRIAGSPNVYWAIAALPDPLIGMRTELERQLGLARRFAPWLAHVETDDLPPEAWRERFSSLLADLLDQSIYRTSPVNEDLMALAMTGLALQHYSPAKQTLLRRGFPPEEVAAMPVGQALAIQQRYLQRIVAAELLKPLLIEPSQATQVHKKTTRTMETLRRIGSPLTTAYPMPLMVSLLPGVRQPVRVAYDLQARFAVLRTIEAIRMYAAKMSRLPPSLAEIEAVPVPDNPFTDEPFAYSLKGETAVLSMMTRPKFPSLNVRYELTLKIPEDAEN